MSDELTQEATEATEETAAPAEPAEATPETPEAPAEAPAEAPIEETAPAEEAAPAEGGVLENVARKPDASHGALAELILKGETITHELLDEIEKRADVADVSYLVAFCRHLLGAQEA